MGKSVAWLRENQKCQEKTVDDRLFSDAESRRDVWNRLKDFYESILADESEHILIVSFFQVNPDGKHILRRLSDLSYIR
ncbi:MAG: hypothetical protein EOM07_07385 [Clostridia bacterium]|nr:hypothetical protein [Clostridia bacterium]